MQTVVAVLTAVALAACGEERHAGAAAVDAAPAPVALDAAVAPAVVDAAPPQATAAHDFVDEARALAALALCDGDSTFELPAGVRRTHCARIAAISDRYRRTRLEPLREFLAGVVPHDLPSTVVYPFAGGDLSTALTVFPTARELTTLALEPAGDPRTAASLTPAERARALEVISIELDRLYVAGFSDTFRLYNAMRGGELPTQLVFSLAALSSHGCTLVHVHYFDLDANGQVAYLTDADVARLPPPSPADIDERNRIFGDVELGFRCGDDPTVRIYRHLQANLDDDHLGGDDPRVLRYLEARGQVAAMTKAASYLLGWPSFSRMRRYLDDHVVWMISDASGLPPRFAQPAGFVQEVWGEFDGPHIDAGDGSALDWRHLFRSQPFRPLHVPFGYRDRNGHDHLVVTHKP
ncbi:MAG TPA: hypothetical protein VHE35_20355 [Kofleriaceae bacterium]|nr:hypothetical protein [Kofleriaceae bacterium]